MKNLRLISTTAAILLLGVGAVSAQTIKTDETPAKAPAAQQIAPAETVAPALKSEQRKAPETTGQTAPTAPTAAKEQSKVRPKSQTLDNAPAGTAVKGSSDANGSMNVKNKNRAAIGKRGTNAQASVDDGAVGGPNRVSHRHYRHCSTNIFGYRHCWR
jgi:type IV secretory pathway VirB10-like protein